MDKIPEIKKWGFKKALRWFIFNAAIMAVIVWGTIFDNQRAMNVATGIIIFSLCLYTVAFLGIVLMQGVKDKTEAYKVSASLALSPTWLSVTMDCAILVLLCYAGKWWLFAIYIPHILMELIIRAVREVNIKEIKQLTEQNNEQEQRQQKQEEEEPKGRGATFEA